MRQRPSAADRAVPIAVLPLVALFVLCAPMVRLALAASGDHVWLSRYDDATHGHDLANAMAVSPDGSLVFVTGDSDVASVGEPGYDYVTIAYDATTGAMVWRARYAGQRNDSDVPVSVAVSPDGARVFVTGHSENPYYHSTIATLAYDSRTGRRLWLRRFTRGISDLGIVVAVSPDGTRVFVSGDDQTQSTSDDFLTIAYDAATGAQVWVRTFDGPAHNLDEVTGEAVSPGGTRLFVAGWGTTATNKWAYFTMAYDTATGARNWLRRFDGPAHDSSALAVAVSGDGARVFVTGIMGLPNLSSEWGTLAYDAVTGALLWFRTHVGPGIGGGEANSVASSPDGTLAFVTGVDSGPGNQGDFYTVAYETSTGATVWDARYDGGTVEAPFVVAASSDGAEVFVTGMSSGPLGDYDYATLEYDATIGAQMWVSRYNGPGNWWDIPNSLVVAPDGGTVFVTGESVGSGTGDDYATIAYRA